MTTTHPNLLGLCATFTRGDPPDLPICRDLVKDIVLLKVSTDLDDVISRPDPQPETMEQFQALMGFVSHTDLESTFGCDIDNEAGEGYFSLCTWAADTWFAAEVAICRLDNNHKPITLLVGASLAINAISPTAVRPVAWRIFWASRLLLMGISDVAARKQFPNLLPNEGVRTSFHVSQNDRLRMALTQSLLSAYVNHLNVSS